MRLWLRGSKQARLDKPTEMLLASRPTTSAIKTATVVNLRLASPRPRWEQSKLAADSHARIAPHRNLTAHTQTEDTFKRVKVECSKHGYSSNSWME